MLPAVREFALDIKNVLAEVGQRGYADRAAIWNELTPSPANHIPRADGLRIRKFTPKNLVESMGGIILRTSQLDPDVLVSPHPAPDVLGLRLCSCGYNRGSFREPLRGY